MDIHKMTEIIKQGSFSSKMRYHFTYKIHSNPSIDAADEGCTNP